MEKAVKKTWETLPLYHMQFDTTSYRKTSRCFIAYLKTPARSRAIHIMDYLERVPDSSVPSGGKKKGSKRSKKKKPAAIVNLVSLSGGGGGGGEGPSKSPTVKTPPPSSSFSSIKVVVFLIVGRNFHSLYDIGPPPPLLD